MPGFDGQATPDQGSGPDQAHGRCGGPPRRCAGALGAGAAFPSHCSAMERPAQGLTAAAHRGVGGLTQARAEPAQRSADAGRRDAEASVGAGPPSWGEHRDQLRSRRRLLTTGEGRDVRLDEHGGRDLLCDAGVNRAESIRAGAILAARSLPGEGGTAFGRHSPATGAAQGSSSPAAISACTARAISWRRRIPRSFALHLADGESHLAALSIDSCPSAIRSSTPAMITRSISGGRRGVRGRQAAPLGLSQGHRQPQILIATPRALEAPGAAQQPRSSSLDAIERVRSYPSAGCTRAGGFHPIDHPWPHLPHPFCPRSGHRNAPRKYTNDSVTLKLQPQPEGDS